MRIIDPAMYKQCHLLRLMIHPSVDKNKNGYRSDPRHFSRQPKSIWFKMPAVLEITVPVDRRNAYVLQNRIIMFSLPIPTLICLWENYISRMGLSILLPPNMYVDRSWEYINRSKTHECGNRDWGRAIPRRGMHKMGFSLQWEVQSSDEKMYGMDHVSTISSCLWLKHISCKMPAMRNA